MAKKNKWYPLNWPTHKRQAVGDKLEVVKGATRAVERGFVRNSILLDEDYDRLLTAVSDLYGLLELDVLAEDNRKRTERHKHTVNRSRNEKDARNN